MLGKELVSITLTPLVMVHDPFGSYPPPLFLALIYEHLRTNDEATGLWPT